MSALGWRAGASSAANSSAIGEAFARAKSQKRAAFIPYITAGDPDLETSAVLLRVLADSGADIIELGVPFSDPIADGIVNQRAATRALASGTTLSGLLQLVSRSRDQIGIPIVLFTYFNPLHARGLRLFAEQASASGVDGVLCVDLPPIEAATDYVPALRDAGIDTVFLLAPTSCRPRSTATCAAPRRIGSYTSSGCWNAKRESKQTNRHRRECLMR